MRYIDLMLPQTYTSRRLYENVKLHRRSAAELATDAGLDASTLSLAMHRRRKVRLNDPRFIRLGRLVGLKKAEVFEPLNEEASGSQ